jgi:predicted Fe-Mo cluster-binding NifX family protein
MRVALPIWNDRIAPVFDVCQRLLLMDLDVEDFVKRDEVMLSCRPEADAGAGLGELGIDVLVCGAISRCLEVHIRNRGIRVIPFVAGAADTVFAAWREGRLRTDRYAMPGCGGRRRHCHGCRQSPCFSSDFSGMKQRYSQTKGD